MSSTQQNVNPVSKLEFATSYFRKNGVSSSGNINAKEKEMAQFSIELIQNSCTGVDRYEETTLDVCEGSECDSSDSDTDSKILAPATGKMGKKELKQWFKEAFFLFSDENCVLLFDSWTTYSDTTCIEDIPPGKTI
ncbi:hypothetical protein ANN_26766 [Periplaneta americana]|uniref:DDE-1 domain-containing protein n=1 Tax=Periplaneta americana TaxID=6978 RepID=A0ABQ8RZ81_PERAM|nr:hypothetical protein ANN_26766 [Periplaneta americana]